MDESNLNEKLADIQRVANDLFRNMNEITTAWNATIDIASKRVLEPLRELLTDLEKTRSASMEIKRLETNRLVQDLVDAQNRLVYGLAGGLLDGKAVFEAEPLKRSDAKVAERVSVAEPSETMVIELPAEDGSEKASSIPQETDAAIKANVAEKRTTTKAKRTPVKKAKKNVAKVSVGRGRKPKPPEPVAVPVPDIAVNADAPAVNDAAVNKATDVNEVVENDLSKLTGLGPLLMTRLRQAGIFQFRQIARPSEEDAKKLESFKSMKNFDLWVKEAEALMEGS
jgi:large subunit ribosomal protein L21